MEPINRVFPPEPGQVACNLELNLLVFREQAGDREVWVAQCLQYDICVQAPTLDKLQHRFERTLLNNLVLAVENGEEPLANFSPAPSIFVKAWEKAETLGRGFPVVLSPDNLPSPGSSCRPRAICGRARGAGWPTGNNSRNWHRHEPAALQHDGDRVGHVAGASARGGVSHRPELVL